MHAAPVRQEAYPRLLMTRSDRLLRQVLTFQGVFLLILNLWSLLDTARYLSFANPGGDVFSAQSVSAFGLILAIFFLVGSRRSELLRPAAFLGLGSAAATLLVELFHLPSIGWTLLWFDLAVELALALAYVTLFFFQGKEEEAPIAAPVAENDSPEIVEAEPEEDA